MRHRAHEVRLEAITTLRRGRRVFIPRGDTLLQPDGVLVVVAEGQAREVVRRLCGGEPA